MQASNALDTLLAQRASTSGNASQGSNNGGGANNGTGPAPTSGGANSGAGGNSPSSQDLIAYQKAVDAAAVQLAVAQQALAQATITSPIGGTVAAVNIAVGDDVSSASSTQNIVVVGEGGFEVTTSIGVDDLPDVAVGQRATIQPDGSGKPITGKVVSIGLSGTSASSTTTYPVIIGLDGDTSGLRNGSLATVTIVTKSAASRLAVPTSAVSTNGNDHTVRVVDGDGDPKTVNVGVGAIGATWTEITSGLTAGQRVVIADLGEPLPGSATASSNGNDNNGRNFPGGGAFPGGNFGRRTGAGN